LFACRTAPQYNKEKFFPIENYVFSDVEMVREFVEGWDLVQVRRTIGLNTAESSVLDSIPGQWDCSLRKANLSLQFCYRSSDSHKKTKKTFMDFSGNMPHVHMKFQYGTLFRIPALFSLV
jgi:hypothetical protein